MRAASSISAALTATTHGELRRLMADLPERHLLQTVHTLDPRAGPFKLD